MTELHTRKASLFLRDIALSVSLGWPAIERAQKQTIHIDIYVAFDTLPLACQTDQLHDTICYDEVIQHLLSLSEVSFHLIEHLAEKVYVLMQTLFPPRAKITLCVNKKPQIAALEGGVSFYYGDEKITW